MGFQVQDDDADKLVELLKAGGIRHVSDEADGLNLPGVWVCTLGYTFNTAKKGSYTLNGELRLLVDDQNPRRARKALQRLLNQVLEVVDPAAPVQARAYLIPEHQPALVPGLRVPVNVRVTTQES